jgi:hypothetical protein
MCQAVRTILRDPAAPRRYTGGMAVRSRGFFATLFGAARDAGAGRPAVAPLFPPRPCPPPGLPRAALPPAAPPGIVVAPPPPDRPAPPLPADVPPASRGGEGIGGRSS